jgi:heme/copper-type cytochrome/quinol oxidase subunit 4
MPEITRTPSSRLALLVPAGAALFTVAWLVLGAVSPGYEFFGNVIAPYSWISQPVSGLGLGVTGPWMNAAFIVCGILILIGTLATAGRWTWIGGLGATALVLMSLMGAGMIVCGIFTLESMMLHLSGFLLAIPLPAIGFLFAAAAQRRRDAALARVALSGGIVTLVLFAAFMLSFDATGAGGNEGVAGIVQRALIVIALATQSLLVVGIAARANPPSSSEARSAATKRLQRG